jgi:hypothetical protein
MPTFFTSTDDHQPIPDDTYVLKVLSAVERISERGNVILVMKQGLPDDHRPLPCVLTFVEAAGPVINAFCESTGLQRPPGDGVGVELTVAHCRGRYPYVTIINDVIHPASDPVPRISRFVSHEQALIKIPGLARINLQQQSAVVLPVVCRTDNAAPTQLPNSKPSLLFRDEPCRTIPD